MSGLGRRSHYRKHLTDAVLNDYPEPDPSEGERIGKVVGTRGSNQFEVILAPLQSKSYEKEETITTDDLCESPSEAMAKTAQLAILPTKYRKLVWLKRNDYVIVRCVDDEDIDVGDTGSIRNQIEHILYKDQVKHLKKEGLWPNDPFFSVSVREGESEAKSENHKNTAATLGDLRQTGGSESDEEGIVGNRVKDSGNRSTDCGVDGIVYNEDSYDDFFVNTNRISELRVQDSDTESDDD